MIEKKITPDLIEILENGCIQIREATKIIDDGVQISEAFHRHVVCPGDDYSQEDTKIQVICAAVHTLEVIAAYQAEQAKLKPASPA